MQVTRRCTLQDELERVRGCFKEEAQVFLDKFQAVGVFEEAHIETHVQANKEKYDQSKQKFSNTLVEYGKVRQRSSNRQWFWDFVTILMKS